MKRNFDNDSEGFRVRKIKGHQIHEALLLERTS